MAHPLLPRGATFTGRPWTLKQVQGDEFYKGLALSKADLLTKHVSDSRSIGKRALPALLAAPLLCGMAPGDMSVAAFLARANAVTRLGPLAMATPEAYRLKNEVIATARRYKARIDTQRRAGRKTTSCPPESGTLTPEEWLAHLNGYPARVRGKVSIYAAFDALMKKRYPCPA